MTNKNLEEIFWDKGKFVNNKGRKVNPQPVLNPMLIIFYDATYIRKAVREKQKSLSKEENLKINAYAAGRRFNDDEKMLGPKKYSIAVQLYKI